MKLMIVDDEYIVRRGMKEIIPWGEMNVTIAGEAENALEAIQTARRVLPDIVICDICLPGMSDGFHVIEEVRRIVPWVQFIMITAHSDRGYIRRAIHEQVCDYLYKPAQVGDIKSAIIRASQKVDDYMEKMHHDLQYHSFMMDNIDVLREKYINQLICATMTEEKARKDAEFLRINLMGPCWRVLIVRGDVEPAYAMLQQLALAFEAWHPVIARAETDPCKILLILNCSDETDEDVIRSRAQTCCGADVALSPLCKTLADLSGIEKRLKPRAAVKHNQPRETLTVELRIMRDNLYEAVKYHDSIGEVERLFALFLDEMEKKEYSEEKILQECRTIMDTICILANIPREQAWDAADIVQLRKNFSALYKALQKAQDSPLDDISRKALYYIKKKYREDLSLAQMAAELFLSASYLSRVVKEQTGHGFGYWLNYYRIQAAQEMLKETDATVEQVAESCGYHSYRIFSENFRKYTGKTATTWRMDEK